MRNSNPGYNLYSINEYSERAVRPRTQRRRQEVYRPSVGEKVDYALYRFKRWLGGVAVKSVIGAGAFIVATGLSPIHESVNESELMAYTPTVEQPATIVETVDQVSSVKVENAQEQNEVVDPNRFTEADNLLIEYGMSLLPEETAKDMRSRLPAIEKKLGLYKQVAEEMGLPWQIPAAIDLRECDNRLDASMFAGEDLGEKNPDSNTVKPTDPLENIRAAMRTYIKNAKRYSGIEPEFKMKYQDLAETGLDYNRGGMPENAIKHIGRRMSVEESAYVMAGITPDKVGMKWFDQGHYGAGEDWGEPESVHGKVEKRPGFLAAAIALGYIPQETKLIRDADSQKKYDQILQYIVKKNPAISHERAVRLADSAVGLVVK